MKNKIVFYNYQQRGKILLSLSMTEIKDMKITYGNMNAR